MLFRSHFSTLFGLSLSSKVLVSAASSSTSRTAVSGYAYGQSVPVSCLNRTIDSGEHIKDDLGRLQYIPFPTCNETSLPLALRYGVTETISCTIDSLPDELYHLLEYYVHSDAPLTCRVPTIPLDSSSSSISGADSGEKQQQYDVVDISGAGGSDDRPYTPLTIALQGTLQLSHLHIWTDMNVLMHRLSSVESPRKEDEDIKIKKQKQRQRQKHRSSRRENQSPGYVVAGIAYSLPELHVATGTGAGAAEMKQKEEIMSQKEEDAAMIANARMPWTPGHGSKVVRGEPLTLKFRVSWVSGADSLGWLDHEDQHQHQHGKTGGGAGTVLGFLTKMVFFFMAAGIGALFASYYQRVVRRRGGGGGGPGSWRGEGILGRSMTAVKGQHRGNFSGVTYGTGGRSNGYGGYSPSSSVASTPVNGGGHGYGGYGKKD